MGEVTVYKCYKCGNEVELNEGCGMRWHSFNKSMFYPPKTDFDFNIYDELDEKILHDIHKFIEEDEDVSISDVYYQPYICNKCGKIESKIYFKMYSANKTFRVLYTCNCGGRYKKITNKDKENLRCNKCGEQMIEDFERHLCWD